MSSATQADGLLLALGAALACGSVAGVLAHRLRVPDVAAFLLAGIAAGPALLGWVHLPPASTANQLLLTFGACYILFEGGCAMRLPLLRALWRSVVLLATLGVLITAAITALAAHWLLGLPPVLALLLAAVIASTDPATLVPVFRQVPVTARIEQTVISESALNDAVGAILTFTVLAVAQGGSWSWSGVALDLLRQAGVGLLAGAVLGYGALLLIAHERYAFLHEFAPAVTLVAVAGAWLGAEHWQASGFMAVFVAGVFLGNPASFGMDMPEESAARMRQFIDEAALILRTLIFVLLGAQLDLAGMARYAGAGLGVVAVFMLLARPAAVYACTGLDRSAGWSASERRFMCWTRETGVIPAALAGMLAAQHAPAADMISAVTFVAVLVTIVVQAPTTPWLARKLGVLRAVNR